MLEIKDFVKKCLLLVSIRRHRAKQLDYIKIFLHNAVASQNKKYNLQVGISIQLLPEMLKAIFFALNDQNDLFYGKAGRSLRFHLKKRNWRNCNAHISCDYQPLKMDRCKEIRTLIY